VPHCAVVFQSYAGYEEEIVLFPSSRPRAPLLQHLPALVRESPRPLPSLHQRSSACTSIPYEQAPLGALIQLTIGCVAAQPVAEEQHAIDLRAARREDMEIDVGVMFSLCEQVYLRYAQKGIFLPRFPQGYPIDSSVSPMIYYPYRPGYILFGPEWRLEVPHDVFHEAYFLNPVHLKKVGSKLCQVIQNGRKFAVQKA
jgi:hypothetical protein